MHGVPEGDDPLDWLLFRQHGTISWRQARHFMSEATLRHRVRSGRWRRVHRSVYLTHGGPVDQPATWWIAVLATGCVLGGATALACCGLDRYRGSGIHVLAPASRQIRRPPGGVVVHRTRVLPRAHLHLTGDPPCTSPARSVVDAAQWASSDDDACALVAAAFQRRLLGRGEVESVLERLPRARRRNLIIAAAGDAASGAHSLAELDYLRLNRRFGLPEPTLQHRRRDARGRTRYLDVYYERFGVHVEIDGGQHNDPRHQWADMRRQNDLWVAGDRVLRFPAWLPRSRPNEVFAQVRAALAAAGWAGGAAAPADRGTAPLPS